MSEKQRTFRLPMIEMVIIIGIFLVVSVFIVKMFVSTDRLGKQAVNISRCTIELQNIAETIKGSQQEQLLQILDAVSFEDNSNTYVIYYDNQWNRTTKESDNIIMIYHTVKTNNIGTMNTYQIVAYDSVMPKGESKSDEPLGHLTVNRFILFDS